MYKTGIIKTHPITREEYEEVKMEESDFDFSKDYDDIDLNTKANFCSFIGHGFPSLETKSMWEYFQMKQMMDI